jgi:hypothetical protein
MEIFSKTQQEKEEKVRFSVVLQFPPFFSLPEIRLSSECANRGVGVQNVRRRVSGETEDEAL